MTGRTGGMWARGTVVLGIAIAIVAGLGLLPSSARAQDTMNPAPGTATALATPTNLDFEQGNVGGIPFGWQVGNVSSAYGVGVSSVKPLQGSYCATIFSKGKPTPGQFGNLMQTVDAAPYRGKRVRFRAVVRLERDRDRRTVGGAGLWIRVDRQSGAPSYFDNMDSQLVTGPQWRRCDIVVDVPRDAQQVNFGMLLVGQGRAYLDAATFGDVRDRTTIPPPVPTTGTTTGERRPALPNGDFERGQPNAEPPGWFVPIVTRQYGYGVKLSRYKPRQGRQCVMLFQFPQATRRGATGFGILMQSFDATPLRGKRVRLRAAVRVEANSTDDRAALWFRVDRARGVAGFFDDMANRPITARAWRYYEIVGDVAPDAAQINLGLLLLKGGKVYLDDVSLTIVGDTPKEQR